MARILSHILFFFFFFFFSLSSASGHRQHTSKITKSTCKASRDPPACEHWLSGHVPTNATNVQAIQIALHLTTDNLNTGRHWVHGILNISTQNQNRTNAAKTCLELLQYSDHRISLVGPSLNSGNLKDARAWMSAALLYQYDCWSALKYVNDTPLVGQTMAFFNSSLIMGTSSALGMIVNYDLFGNSTGKWGPAKTERDGFWEHTSGTGSGSGPAGGVPVGRKKIVRVCKGRGGCDYKTVQEAVNAAPNNSRSGKWFVIRIGAGVYNETVRVPLEKKNVVFLGEGIGKTVITGSKNVGLQPGMSTYNSATVAVAGDNFRASHLTIENTAGPNAHQAVAFRSDSDHSLIENCEFLGNQDTLYAHSLRQYYKNCLIQGNVDFIFGNSAALFQDCLILVAPRQSHPEKGEQNAVTAHGRTDPAQSTGFVFWNSVINGTKEYMDLYYKNSTAHLTYLGRPWKEYSRTVFIQSTLEDLIAPEGWMIWDGNFALATLYYGEFNNTGPGSNRSKRVTWSSPIPAKHVGSYSAQNFIQAN